MGTGNFPGGNGNYYIDVDAAVESQNYAGNYSTIYWRVIVRKRAGSGFWSYSDGRNTGWAKQWPSGSYVWQGGNIAYDFRGRSEILFAEGRFNLPHDGNGYATYAVDGGMDLVNLGGAYATSGNKSAPRIPKAPNPPTMQSITARTDVSFGVNYSRGADNGAGIQGDEIQWSSTSNFSSIVWSDTNPVGYSNPRGLGNGPGPLLTPHKQYWVRGRSRNSQGWSGWSNTITATTLGQPTVPQNLAVTPSTSVTGRNVLTWTAPATVGEGGIVGYNIFRDGTQIASTTGSATGYTDNGLTPHTSYSYTVGARNAWSVTTNSMSPRTAAVSAVAPGPPSAPRNLTAVSSTTVPGQVTLTWQAPTTTGAGGVTSYKVYRSEGTLVGTTSSLTYTVTGLNPGTEYTFMVKALNALSTAEGSQSAQSNYATVTPIGEPLAPTGLTATPSPSVARRLVLSWTSPSTGISGYSIFRRVNGVDTLIAKTPSGDTTFPVDALVSGEPYSFVVRARTAYTDTLSDGYPGNWGGSASNVATGIPTADFTQTVPNLSAAQSQTNAVFNGTYTINALTADSIGFAKTSEDIARASVGGSVTNNTNVVFNGTYTITATTASSLSFAKTASNITSRGASGGSIVNNTNTELSGVFTIGSVNVGANLFTYTKTGADISSRAVPVNPAPGKSSTVTNRSNLSYNGTGKTVTSITEYTLTYTQTGSNLPETNAAGRVLNITNRDTFNGDYTVSTIPAYDMVRYNKTAANITRRTWITKNGEVSRVVSPAKLDVRYRSGWAG
ncbi:minor tail protein [Microbacterium phage Cece]|nr:minor tail protein [Microbacterium phage Cece]